jgi:sugar lactone lactonase YvrE
VGNIWIATEDHGVYRYCPSAPKGKQILQFTTQNTHGQLGNNNTDAIACDNHDRVWAGTLNHGVAVYNRRHWQDYDIVQNPQHHVLAGPLGNHVFAMKFDKYTHQMWICTEAGISIYQCSAARRGAVGQPGGINPAARRTVTYNLSPVTYNPGTWHYVTQANGLLQNPDCIAFNPDGTVYVGTQCDGIAIGTPNHIAAGSAGGSTVIAVNSPIASSDRGPVSTHYSLSAAFHHSFNTPAYRWHTITGPWKMPLTATGKGLPSNLVNAIALAPSGTPIAGTDGGIAFAARDKTARPTAGVSHIATGSAGGLIPRQAPSDVTSPVPAKMRWTFLHGRDFTAKVAGLWHPPRHWHAPSQEGLNTLPMEDYTTAIAFNDQRPMINDKDCLLSIRAEFRLRSSAISKRLCGMQATRH